MQLLHLTQVGGDAAVAILLLTIWVPQCWQFEHGMYVMLLPVSMMVE